MREVAAKVADMALHNAGYIRFIKIALVAMFLGLYRRANYRAGWRMRFSIYQLFFFALDPRLGQHRVSKRSADGQTAASLGGSAAAMACDYDINRLYDGIRAPLSPNKCKRAEAANARFQYSSYIATVAAEYAASFDSQKKATQTKKAPAAPTPAVDATKATSTLSTTTVVELPKTTKKKNANKANNDTTRRWQQGQPPVPDAADYSCTQRALITARRRAVQTLPLTEPVPAGTLRREQHGAHGAREELWYRLLRAATRGGHAAKQRHHIARRINSTTAKAV